MRPAPTLYRLVVLLALTAVASAQTSELQVRPADREQLTQQPRDIVSVAFTVRNDGQARAEIEPRLVLPSGWRTVTPDFPFTLSGKQSIVRLVSFVIPETARAGEYPLTYEARNRQIPSVSSAYTVRVRILPAPNLQVALLEAPQFAVAGETYRAVFVARNTGNSPVKARFTARSAQGFEVDPQSGDVALDPGESQSLAIAVATPRVRRRVDEYLSVTVETADAAVNDTASAPTQIVPRVSAGEAYHTLSSEVGLSFVARETGEERHSGWQAEWSGNGTIDEENARHIGFRLRGPDTREQGSLGDTDEYALQYWDDTTSASLGDSIYGLSLLTEPGRYGRGASAGYKTEDFDVSAYRARDRYGATDRQQAGFNAHYALTPGARFGVNLLDKTGGELPAQIGSVQSQITWGNALYTDVELARSDGDGERGDAFRGGIYDNSHALRYYAIGWHADPGFRGYLRDEEYLTTGFDYPRPKSWGLRGYYRLQNQNLEADPTRPAPQEQQASLGTERLVGESARISLDYGTRTYVDRYIAADGATDIANRSARLGVSRSFKDISLLYAIERGKTLDRLTRVRFDTSLHMLSAYWKVSPAQSYSIYALRDDNTYSHEREQVQTTVGLSGSYQWRAGTVLNLDLERNSAAAKRHSTYNLSLLHRLRDGDRLELIARRIEGRVPQTDVLLTYSVPFDLPIFRRANVATLHGRVYDAETGAGVNDVVLNLDGMTAVTGAGGAFEFPAVEAGGYQLSMDRSNVDVDKVPVDDLPLGVIVTAQDSKRVDIALIRSIAVSVNVHLPANNSDSTLAANRGVQNVLVTLKRGDRVYRRLTDANGHMRLAGLAPGRWLASIAADTLPSGYAAASMELSLEALPGGSTSAEFPLRAVTRDMRMLPPLRLK